VDDPRTCYLRNGAGRSMLTKVAALLVSTFALGRSLAGDTGQAFGIHAA
jgi:hypothetical protein